MDLRRVVVDLTNLPSGVDGLSRLVGPGIPIAAVLLEGNVPAGVTFRLVFGEKKDAPITFSRTAGLVALDGICDEVKGLFGTWAPAAPGQTVELRVWVTEGPSITVGA